MEMDKNELTSINAIYIMNIYKYFFKYIFPAHILIYISSAFAENNHAITGTGFFISNDCHMITNNHVIENARIIYAIESSGARTKASVLVQDKGKDLALLKVDGKTCKPIILLNSDLLRKGDAVHTLGYPMPSLQGPESKFTTGIVSSLTGLMGNPFELQITTPIQPGNSGGPLLNDSGYAVGVIVAKLKPLTDSIPEAVNYAIKSLLVIDMLRTAKIKGQNNFIIANSIGTPKKLQQIAATAEDSVIQILSIYGANELAKDQNYSKKLIPNLLTPSPSEKSTKIEFDHILIDGIKWIRPSNNVFKDTFSPPREKGIRFYGPYGSDIHAVSDGVVVYASDEIGSYGKMIVIKHDEIYLSSYSQNSSLMVKKGDKVFLGQKISEMGEYLGFEIRRRGQPIHPKAYLP